MNPITINPPSPDERLLKVLEAFPLPKNADCGSAPEALRLKILGHLVQTADELGITVEWVDHHCDWCFCLRRGETQWVIGFPDRLTAAVHALLAKIKENEDD